MCVHIAYIAIDPYLTELVKVFEVCLVKSIPHNFNVHVIQVLQQYKSSTNLSIYQCSHTHRDLRFHKVIGIQQKIATRRGINIWAQTLSGIKRKIHQI